MHLIFSVLAVSVVQELKMSTAHSDQRTVNAAGVVADSELFDQGTVIM